VTERRGGQGEGRSDALALASPTDTTPNVIDGVAFARLYGEPLFRMPTDLYIPPDALEVFLEAFEGPLDLLLYLIRKQNFNILDIPMAAMLIEIKSRMLLPMKKADSGEEAADPRAELVRRLLEYERIKLASWELDAIPQLGRDYVRTQIYIEQSVVTRWPEVNAADLQGAWADVLKRANLTAHHTISREELSVREHMTGILRRLQSARFVEFADLFDPSRGVPVLIVNFIALLELAKETLIEITQGEPFAPIYVRLSYSKG
jgi:segregation and condensation protein A